MMLKGVRPRLLVSGTEQGTIGCAGFMRLVVVDTVDTKNRVHDECIKIAFMAFVYTTRCKESLTGVSGAAAHPSLTGRVTRRLAADSARNFKSRRYDRRRLNGNRRF